MTAGHREFISALYGRLNRRKALQMKTRIISLSALAIGVAAAVVGAAFAPQARSQGAGGAPPMPPASSFSAHVDNPWFPLLPGTR